MTPTEYAERALAHCSNAFEGAKPDLIHGIVGVCSEAGELADLLEKLHFHPSKVVTSDKIIDECGDVLWYLALTLRAAGSSLEEAMIKNVAKLDLRYNINNGNKNKQAEKEAQANVGNGGKI